MGLTVGIFKNIINFDDVIKLLPEILEMPFIDPNSMQWDGYSIIEYACIHGHIEVIKLLMENERFHPHGVISNTQWHTYGSILHIVCNTPNPTIIDFLLNHERITDINQQDKNGEIPFSILCRQEHYTHSDGNTLRPTISSKQKIDSFKLFLNDERIDFNKPNKYGYTPFHLTCRHYKHEFIKLFFEMDNINFNTVANNCDTPFSSVCEHMSNTQNYTFTDTLELLLSNPVININNSYRKIFQTGNITAVKILLKSDRIDLTETDSDGNTIFHQACDPSVRSYSTDPYLDVVKLLRL